MSHPRISAWTRQLILVIFIVLMWLGITVVAVHFGRVAPVRPGEQARHAYWMAAYFAPAGYLLLLALYVWAARRIRSGSD